MYYAGVEAGVHSVLGVRQKAGLIGVEMEGGDQLHPAGILQQGGAGEVVNAGSLIRMVIMMIGATLTVAILKTEVIDKKGEGFLGMPGMKPLLIQKCKVDTHRTDFCTGTRVTMMAIERSVNHRGTVGHLLTVMIS